MTSEDLKLLSEYVYALELIEEWQEILDDKMRTINHNESWLITSEDRTQALEACTAIETNITYAMQRIDKAFLNRLHDSENAVARARKLLNV
jgi:hypothetical protein